MNIYNQEFVLIKDEPNLVKTEEYPLELDFKTNIDKKYIEPVIVPKVTEVGLSKNMDNLKNEFVLIKEEAIQDKTEEYHLVSDFKPYQCIQCAKAFTTQSKLTAHIRSHTTEKPYQCTHCDKDFSRKTRLTRHIRTHTGEKPYKCSHCDKAFSRKCSLVRHLRILSGEKPYMCSHCEKSFSCKGNLIKHFMNTHGKENPYQCGQCDKAFPSKYSLTCHIRTHTHTGERPYKCTHCDMAFSKKDSFTRHIRKHTGEKPCQGTHVVIMGSLFQIIKSS